jgi:hypothetical protein
MDEWLRILLETLTAAELLNKVPAFYGRRRFIAVHIRVRHRSQP